MATLPGQRAQFTWALNQYNSSDDPDERRKYVRRMAKYIQAAPLNGFSKEQVTQGQSYPADEVQAVLNDPSVVTESDVSEAQALETLEKAVDTGSVLHVGTGSGSVYAYGYRCAPDRLKIGYTDGDTVQRIAAQIGTSTPDKPVLFLEIRADNSRALERALHAVLAYRGKKVIGGGAEWFVTTTDELKAIYAGLDAKSNA